MTTEQFLIKAYQQHLIALAMNKVSEEELDYISSLYSDEDDYFDAQECIVFAEDEPSLSNLALNNNLLQLINNVPDYDEMTEHYYEAMKTIKLQQPNNEFVGYWWVVFSLFYLLKKQTPKSEIDVQLNSLLEKHSYLKLIEDFI